MQLSTGKLATLSISLLISLTIITTGAGLYVLQTDYRTLETRHETEARDSVRNAARALRNQILFYQGALQLMAENPEISGLLEFADTPEFMRWSQAVARSLPGALGTALVSPAGIVFIDPLTPRMGPTCRIDMQKSALGGPVGYPLLHTDVAGLEHFDLLTRVAAPTGEDSGTLFVSFRRSVLEDLLQRMMREGDHFQLLNEEGHEKLSVGNTVSPSKFGTYRAQIPDSPWELLLHRPTSAPGSSPIVLVVTNAMLLFVAGVLLAYLARKFMGRLGEDMARVHTALQDVLEGRYQPSKKPTSFRETGMLLPDIEQLALKIRQHHDNLDQQSLSDTLTGVFNHRYHDMMLAHLHEQSQRHSPATLAIIDLNDFKQINDEYGHAEGDRVLQDMASYLQSRVRATDIVARVGGDEFAVLLTHMAGDMLEDWLAALVHDYDHQLLEGNAGAASICQFSIGVAQVDAQIYPTPAAVFNAADGAMYAVKQRRGIRHSRYAIARPSNVTAITTAKQAL